MDSIYPGRCDFCSVDNPTWNYPAKDLISVSPIACVALHSVGEWAACEECHMLLQAGKRHELAERSVRMNPNQAQMRKVQAKGYDPVAIVRKVHDDFWTNREGQPTRVALAEPIA